MRVVLFGIIFFLALGFLAPVLAEENGTIDPGGIVVERQAEQGSVKGVFSGRLDKLGSSRYWTAVFAFTVFSLLVFEVGWRLGAKASKNHKS